VPRQPSPRAWISGTYLWTGQPKSITDWVISRLQAFLQSTVILTGPLHYSVGIFIFGFNERCRLFEVPSVDTAAWDLRTSWISASSISGSRSLPFWDMNFSSSLESLIFTMTTATLYHFRHSLTVTKISSLAETVIGLQCCDDSTAERLQKNGVVVLDR